MERELDWLLNMQDWMISKKRYWGLALPIFDCEACGTFEVIGSETELKERAVSGWEQFEGHTPHRPYVDEVTIACSRLREHGQAHPGCRQSVAGCRDRRPLHPQLPARPGVLATSGIRPT